jgi:tetratricopeptide (TPR) repeat protein
MKNTSFSKLYLFFIPFICIYSTSFANIDSLKNIADISTDKYEIAKTYIKLSDKYLDIDIDTARKYADSAKKIGLFILDFKILSDANINYANSYYYQGKLDSALVYFEKSYENILKTRDSNEIAAALNRLGLIHEALSNYSKASEYYYKALNIYDETNHQMGLANIYNNLGVLNDAMGIHEESYKNYKIALSLYDKNNNSEGKANVYNNLATYFASRDKINQAIDYINMSIQILAAANRKNAAATAYYNASILYSRLEKCDTAKLYLDSALINYEYTNNIHGIANVYNEEAKLCHQNKNYKNAIDLLFRSLELRKKVGSLSSEAQTIKQISDFYSESGNHEKALYYYKEYQTLQDSIFDLNTRQVISELNIKYETEKKDTEINLLKKESAIKRVQNNLLIIIINRQKIKFSQFIL